jgi:acyl-CoA thioester hydrolase
MRWADLDLLGHVNNVVYVDYLQEARVDMLRVHRPSLTSDLAEAAVVVRNEVTYLAPLTFRFEPVSIDVWVSELRAASFTLAYEIYQADPADPGNPEARRVHARATTVLTPYVFATERPRRLTDEERTTLEQYVGPAPTRERVRMPRARPDAAHRFAVQVRFSDVDVYRHVNNVKYFEYLQEGRIALTADIWAGLDPVSLVVARTDVDYLRPILLRPEPYDAWSWVSRVGERSATIDTLICDGPTTLASGRAVIVFFDQQTQRSTEPDEAHREALRSLLPPG